MRPFYKVFKFLLTIMFVISAACMSQYLFIEYAPIRYQEESLKGTSIQYSKLKNNEPINYQQSNQSSICRTCQCLEPNFTDRYFKISYEEVTEQQLYEQYKEKLFAATYSPQNCTAQSLVAIVIPFRERQKSLLELLKNLPQFLLMQNMEFALFVIEPLANQTFNRAKLLNVGFHLATKDSKWNCFVFHDVDLIPENLNNYYKCKHSPVHLASAIDRSRYRLPYNEYFGGVSMFSHDQFLKINGFSNDYWGYGGEDDDSYLRLHAANLTVWRYPSSISRYKMKRHDHEKSNPLNACRHELLRKVNKRYGYDGLNSLDYSVVQFEDRLLYKWYLVDLKEIEGKRKMESENLCNEPTIG